MTTRQPLTEASRRILRSRSRNGLLALVLAFVSTAGIGFGIAVKTPGVIALSPIAALLWWVGYAFGVKTLHDLRVGLEEHYDGPWEQRLLRRLRIPDAVLVKLPHLEAVLRISHPPTVNAVVKAGLTEEWSPAAGRLAYTPVHHLMLTVSHGPEQPKGAPRPPDERELHDLLGGGRQRARELRRAQAQQPPPGNDG